jgi:hypothetical protein
MSHKPIYTPAEHEVEARSRIISLLSVCEHELASLEALRDPRLTTVIESMRSLHEDLLITLNTIGQAPVLPGDAP